MSCGNPHQTPCRDILHALVLFIDHEIHDQSQVHAVEIHLQECPPCAATEVQERRSISLLQALLGRSCFEPAPEELHDRILAQTQELANKMSVTFQSPASGPFQIFSEYSRTEITVDGVTQIIETTSEFRSDFPL
jgi:mycothiol system anti-sigma-R factor